MKKFISIGKLDKKYLIIFIIFFITQIIYCFLIIQCDKETNNKTKIRKNFLLNYELTYIGQSLCFIPVLISWIINNKKNKSKIDKGSKDIKYIFNNLEKRINYKDIFIIIFICILLLIDNFVEIYIILKIQTETSIFNYEYFFMKYMLLFLISKYIFKMNYYKHQYLSIILIIFLALFNYLIKIFFDYSYEDKVKDIAIILVLKIIKALLDSIIIGHIKILMESKYLSPYQICSIFGFVNGAIIMITYFLVSYNPCNHYLLCSLEYNNQHYFDNIYSVFEDLNPFEIFFMIYFIFNYGIFQIIIYITVHDYTICHIFLFYQVLEFIDSLFETQDHSILLWIIILSGVLEIFVTLVFLELIELKFCGFEENLKNNIKNRALLDSNISNNDNNLNDDSEFDE